MDTIHQKQDPAHCAGCGDVLPPKTYRGNPRKWCSEACRVATYYRNRPGSAKKSYEKKQEKVRAENAAKYRGAKCEQCGEDPRWSALGVPRRFCSQKCATKAMHERALRENPPCTVDGCDRPQKAKGLCNSHWAKHWYAENPDAYRKSRADYRARKMGAKVGDVRRDAVLERDRWVCGICGEKIQKDAAWPDVRSASIDHVVPLSKGGDHSMANCQASHLGCNVSKKAAGGGEQLALI